ncbi:hypothetical protein T439DRAFT_155720 [Meredithblackwellia eburnea MCA 4105]
MRRGSRRDIVYLCIGIASKNPKVLSRFTFNFVKDQRVRQAWVFAIRLHDTFYPLQNGEERRTDWEELLQKGDPLEEVYMEIPVNNQAQSVAKSLEKGGLALATRLNFLDAKRAGKVAGGLLECRRDLSTSELFLGLDPEKRYIWLKAMKKLHHPDLFRINELLDLLTTEEQELMDRKQENVENVKFPENLVRFNVPVSPLIPPSPLSPLHFEIRELGGFRTAYELWFQ